MAETGPDSGTRWSSNLAFVLVAAGTAVGLGNLWRFPFVAGENGGGAFVIVYLLALAFIGFPIMLAEFVIGRHGRGSARQAIQAVSTEAGASPLWQIIGLLCVLIPWAGIGYYSVVGGWVVDYTASFIGTGGFGFDEPAGYQRRFDNMLASPGRLLGLHVVFMVAVVAVVGLGVREGIERVARILMPGLFILLLALVGYALFSGGFAQSVAFLFSPNFAELTMRGVLIAVGQAFFSIAIGIGALITFGAYMDRETSLPRAAAQVCIADTAVAILAGIAIFSIVFSFGLDPAEGPGLIFVTLPVAFGEMPGGYVVGCAFFVLLFIAAFTSGVGTLEPVVAWLVGRGMRRALAAVLAGGSAWLIGVAAALSFNDWSHIHPLEFMPGWESMTFFDIIDFSVASLLLPINGLLIALFAGWALPRALVTAELGDNAAMVSLWRFFVAVLAPLAIVAILILG